MIMFRRSTIPIWIGISFIALFLMGQGYIDNPWVDDPPDNVYTMRNVGIGTTIPTESLEVDGNLKVNGSINVEPWHEVGAAGETGFQPHWGNCSLSGFNTAGFYKDPFGVVHLRGCVQIIFGLLYEPVVFVLPVGYRPAATERFIAAGEFPPNNEAPIPTLCWVNPNGDLTLAGEYLIAHPDPYLAVSLDGITFRAAN
jgi:hypothetical protein